MYTRGSEEDHLDKLFQAYRAACPDPEPSANFMPELWRKIENRRSVPFYVGRIARGFVTAAVAATLAMAVYLYIPQTSNPFYSESYVEALAGGHSVDNADFLEPALESSEWVGQL